jgi:hypothetical protein
MLELDMLATGGYCWQWVMASQKIMVNGNGRNYSGGRDVKIERKQTKAIKAYLFFLSHLFGIYPVFREI